MLTMIGVLVLWLRKWAIKRMRKDFIIDQKIIYAPSGHKEKRMCLRDILNALPIKNGIIFANRKKDVEILLKSLTVHKFSIGALHGDMAQSARMETLSNFKQNKIQLLVASDVAARGLDIPDVSHVINYDLPIVAEDYVHRVGRTGRAGRSGNAISMVTFDDIKQLKTIENVIKNEIEWAGEKPSDDDFEVSSKLKRRSAKNKHRGPSKYKASTNRREKPAEKAAPVTKTNTVSKPVAATRKHNADIIAFGKNDHIPDFLLRSCALSKTS